MLALLPAALALLAAGGADAGEAPAEPPPVARRPLAFEPLREPREGAFSAELPGAWEKQLTAEVLAGERPSMRASAIASAADRLHAFLHYKPASFQEPVAGLTPRGPGFRAYLPGAASLEAWLFPAVAAGSPRDVAEWTVLRRGALAPLFAHASGVRLDGQRVEYRYRSRGELLEGAAYVVTYRLPGEPSATWMVYALFGWEAPAERAAEARKAARRLAESFQFEGRYAAQGDAFFALAREAALSALGE